MSNVCEICNKDGAKLPRGKKYYHLSCFYKWLYSPHPASNNNSKVIKKGK